MGVEAEAEVGEMGDDGVVDEVDGVGGISQKDKALRDGQVSASLQIRCAEKGEHRSKA